MKYSAASVENGIRSRLAGVVDELEGMVCRLIGTILLVGGGRTRSWRSRWMTVGSGAESRTRLRVSLVIDPSSA